MIINTLNVVFERAELQSLVDRLVGEVDQLKELTLTLEKGRVVLAGRISVGLTIPFSTQWQARVLGGGSSVALALSGVSVGMVGMGKEMISAQLLKLLAAKLQGFDAVRVEKNEIIVDLQPALAARGIKLIAPLKCVEISASGILLETETN